MEERVWVNAGNQDYDEHVASTGNLPHGQDFKVEGVYMWQASAQSHVQVRLIESVSLGHCYNPDVWQA